MRKIKNFYYKFMVILIDVRLIHTELTDEVYGMFEYVGFELDQYGFCDWCSIYNQYKEIIKVNEIKLAPIYEVIFN